MLDNADQQPRRRSHRANRAQQPHEFIYSQADDRAL